jgi:hypothetical protein
MGRMKELSILLAEYVYFRNMSDEAIVETVNLVNPNEKHDDFNRWLLAQIQIVRKNPQLYEPSSGANFSTCGRNSVEDEHMDE